MSRRSPDAAAADAVGGCARRVLSGEIVANRYVRLACERHLADLETEESRGLRFDPDRAGRAIRFFGFLQLEEGRPFTLQPWQAFIVGSVFGWYVRDDDGSYVRRYRNAYIETGKGSGKTVPRVPAASGPLEVRARIGRATAYEQLRRPSVPNSSVAHLPQARCVRVPN